MVYFISGTQKKEEQSKNLLRLEKELLLLQMEQLRGLILLTKEETVDRGLLPQISRVPWFEKKKGGSRKILVIDWRNKRKKTSPMIGTKFWEETCFHFLSVMTEVVSAQNWTRWGAIMMISETSNWSKLEVVPVYIFYFTTQDGQLQSSNRLTSLAAWIRWRSTTRRQHSNRVTHLWNIQIHLFIVAHLNTDTYTRTQVHDGIRPRPPGSQHHDSR